jgi:hypothetical protein
MLLNELFEVSQDLAGRYKTAAIKDVDRAIAAKAAGTMGRDEYERKMTKRGRGTAAAQRRLTPQGTRLDLTPYGDAIQRDYDRYRTDEQGAAEGYQFKGPFPFDVDHMHGGRGINLPKAETKKYFTDKKQWQRAVDDINHSKYDDNSDYIGVTGRSTVEINGREWARWSDAQQKGYIELSSMSEQGVAEGSDGWIGNPAKWKEAVLQAHGPDVTFKNYSHPGQPGKRSVNAINADGKQVGVYQRHNKMGMVQPNQQGVAEGVSLKQKHEDKKRADQNQVRYGKMTQAEFDKKWTRTERPKPTDKEQGVAEGRTK